MSAREPGSHPGRPILSAADGAQAVERFTTAADLARRIHDLRAGAALDVRPGHASFGGPEFPDVLIWTRPREGQGRFLAFAAGPGADAPAALLSALNETRPASRKAA